MKLSTEREALLAPLQAVIGVVERRQTMPILANVLLVAKDDRLYVTATDLEVELVASAELTVQEAGEITVPGRKLLDLMRYVAARVRGKPIKSTAWNYYESQSKLRAWQRICQELL